MMGCFKHCTPGFSVQIDRNIQHTPVFGIDQIHIPVSPAPGAAGPAPEVLALVARINARIDGAVASGQTVENVSTWFRGELIKAGVDANNATLDQIKGVLLAKAPVPALEGIAKLMNA